MAMSKRSALHGRYAKIALQPHYFVGFFEGLLNYYERAAMRVGDPGLRLTEGTIRPFPIAATAVAR
jgi:hypothetical protein